MSSSRSVFLFIFFFLKSCRFVNCRQSARHPRSRPTRRPATGRALPYPRAGASTCESLFSRSPRATPGAGATPLGVKIGGLDGVLIGRESKMGKLQVKKGSVGLCSIAFKRSFVLLGFGNRPRSSFCKAVGRPLPRYGAACGYRTDREKCDILTANMGGSAITLSRVCAVLPARCLAATVALSIFHFCRLDGLERGWARA